MFRCENCGTLTTPSQPLNKVVVEKRQKTYEVVRNRQAELVHGWEIVREINACPKCFTALTGQEAQVVEEKKKVFVPRFKKEYKKDRRDNRDRRRDNRPPRQQQQNQRRPIVETVNPLPVMRK